MLCWRYAKEQYSLDKSYSIYSSGFRDSSKFKGVMRNKVQF